MSRHYIDGKIYLKRIDHVVNFPKNLDKNSIMIKSEHKDELYNQYDKVLGMDKLMFDQIADYSNKYKDFEFENDTVKIIDDAILRDTISYINGNLSENKRAKLIILLQSKDRVYNNGFLKLKCAKGSHLDVVYLQILEENSENYFTISIDAHEEATVNFYSACLGASINSLSVRSNLLGDRSEINMYPIYFADKDKKYDLEYTLKFYGKNSIGNIDARGVTKDNARKVFRGNLIFEKGSTKSEGSEAEFAILLSKQMKSESIPTLFCKEDDVIGAHSANIGKIDEDKLLYLMSRGFNEKEAKKLVVMSSIGPFLDNVEDNLKELILRELDERI